MTIGDGIAVAAFCLFLSTFVIALAGGFRKP